MSTIAATVVGIMVVAAGFQWWMRSVTTSVTLESRLRMLKPGDVEVSLGAKSKDVVVAHRLPIDLEVHRWIGLTQHTITDTRASFTQMTVGLLVLNECLGTNPPAFVLSSNDQRRVHVDICCNATYLRENSAPHMGNIQMDGMTFSRIDEEVFLFHEYSTIYLVGRRNKEGLLVYHTISPTMDAILTKYRVTAASSS